MFQYHISYNFAMEPYSQNLAVNPSTTTLLFGDLLTWIQNGGWTELPISVNEIQGAIGSHLGQKRDRNEDRVACAILRPFTNYAVFVAVVCDGMGGMEDGDQGASIAIASVIDGLAVSGGRLTPQILTSVIQKANIAVHNVLRGKGGTTLSLFACSSDGEMLGANVGDSRIFSWEPCEKIEQLSTDDTIQEQLRRVIAGNHDVFKELPIGGHLTQFVGIGSTLDIEIIPRARFSSVGVFMATDGAWQLNHDAFKQIVGNSKAANEAVRRVIAFANWIGGVDNTSIIALENIERIVKILRSRATSQPFNEVRLWGAEGRFTIATANHVVSNVKAPLVHVAHKQSSGNQNKDELKITKSRRKKKEKVIDRQKTLLPQETIPNELTRKEHDDAALSNSNSSRNKFKVESAVEIEITHKKNE